MQVSKGICFLEVCAHRLFVVLNLPPLKRVRSRNSTRSSLMLHANFRVATMCLVEPI